jgi:hypothetical protein
MRAFRLYGTEESLDQNQLNDLGKLARRRKALAALCATAALPGVVFSAGRGGLARAAGDPRRGVTPPA